MKESTNKSTAGSQTGKSKTTGKPAPTTSSRGGSATRGTASSHSGARASHANNPEGHNQYTKKPGGSKR